MNYTKKYSSKKIVEKVRKLVEKECKKPTNTFGYGFWTEHIIPMVKYAKMLTKRLGAK